jgi:predicted transcriptional regulator
MDYTITPFQEELLRLIKSGFNGSRDINSLAQITGKGRLAVHSSMRSLERKGFAVSWRHRSDQWGVIHYSATTPNVWVNRRGQGANPA